MNRRESILALSGAFVAGAVSMKLIQGIGLRKRISGILEEERVPIELTNEEARRAFVLLVLGQSNAANHGSTRGKAGAGCLSATPDGFFQCEDPLPGASGDGGSIWTRWAGLHRLRNPERQVVVACVAQGSTMVNDWMPGKENHKKAIEVIRFVKRSGCDVGAIVWHQGESESWSSRANGSEYRAKLLDVIDSIRRETGDAPVFVSLASRDPSGVVNESIRSAQKSVWSVGSKVFAGVDMDSFDERYRFDGVHFNQQGLDRAAALMEAAFDAPTAERAFALGKRG